MATIIIQTMVLLGVAFFLGCAAGCWFARRARPLLQALGSSAAGGAGKAAGKRKRTSRRKTSR